MTGQLRKVVLIVVLMLWPTILLAQSFQDNDGDGIPDAWEKAGFVTIALADGTTKKLDLTKDGPLSADHKDIFVWVAWMEDAKHTHKPDPSAMQIVRDAFAKAPIANPDGTKGIRLHIYYNPTPIPEVAMLGSMDSNNNYNWAAFDAIKKQSLPAELAHVFHFCLFAHDFDSVHHSGLSRAFGAYDFIVSLGAFGLNGVAGVQSQAGTFMHELGHNLGLRHGGLDDVNNKPNYISVMNYFFQLDGVPIDGVPGNFDYSRFSLSVDENKLNEELGLSQDPNLARYGSQFFCSKDRDHSQTMDSIVGPQDLDCDGSIDAKITRADINSDLAFNVLVGLNDWQQVRFVYSTPQGGTTPTVRPKPADELSLSQANAFSLPPVAHLQASLVGGGVQLWWARVPLDRMVAYKVIRKSESEGQVELATVTTNDFIDTSAGRGSYAYYVRGLYVPHGGLQQTKPTSFSSADLGKILDSAVDIEAVRASADREITRIETMGIKPKNKATLSGIPYFIETPISAPASIQVR
jgi:hypothetical protein